MASLKKNDEMLRYSDLENYNEKKCFFFLVERDKDVGIDKILVALKKWKKFKNKNIIIQFIC